MMHRPNVLFICCDDLNDAIAGLGGHPQAKTPWLDKLCHRGVRFTNGNVNVPICGPSRASFLSGLQPWTSGYFGYNFTRDPWYNNPVLGEQPTFMEHAAANGYGVYGTGKIFHNGQEKDSVWNRGHGHKVDWGPWTWDGQRPGKGWAACVGHQSLPFDTDAECLFASLADIPDIPPDSSTGAPGYRGWRHGDNRPFHYASESDRDLMNDELNGQWAGEVVGRSHDEPFLCCLGIGRPHSPMIAPQEFFDLFPLDEIELSPQILPDDLDDCAHIMRDGHTCTGDWGFAKYRKHYDNGGEHTLKRWTQAYLACVAFADACIGRTLQALWDGPNADTTYVVLTSDNGYHMGEKDYLFKNSLWERSARVPLLVAGPDCAQGAECTQPVGLVDIFPTINAWCDLPSTTGPKPLDGTSFATLAREPTASWSGPDCVITAIGSDTPVNAATPARAEDQHYTVRSHDWRYLRYANNEEELYDHNADPYEWHNRANDPACASIKATLRQALKEQVGI